MSAWVQDNKIVWRYIAPGKPMQNGFCESFNGRMRDELLNESLFRGLDHTRTKIATLGRRLQPAPSTLGPRVSHAHSLRRQSLCNMRSSAQP